MPKKRDKHTVLNSPEWQVSQPLLWPSAASGI